MTCNGSGTYDCFCGGDHCACGCPPVCEGCEECRDRKDNDLSHRFYLVMIPHLERLGLDPCPAMKLANQIVKEAEELELEL